MYICKYVAEEPFGSSNKVIVIITIYSSLRENGHQTPDAWGRLLVGAPGDNLLLNSEEFLISQCSKFRFWRSEVRGVD